MNVSISTGSRTTNEAGTPKVSPLEPAPDRPEEFQRFEDLTQKLVAVPKTAIDAQREAD